MLWHKDYFLFILIYSLKQFYAFDRLLRLKKGTMKKYILITAIGLSGFIFAGCTKQKNATQQPATNPATQQGASQKSTQKVGDTTKTGTITTISGRFYLTEAGQTPKEIDSYAVELSEYVGKNVTVTGQYSGDTLFVGSIE